MVRDINMLGTRLDKKTIELGKELPPPTGKKLTLSVFQAGLTVTDDIKDFLSFFDTKKDGTIDEKEIVTLKKVLNDYAGKDKVLDKNELLQIFGLTPQSKNADKIVEQFQSIVQRAATGSSQTTTTTENGETITNSFNADGSGTRVVIGKDKDGKEIKQTYTFGKGHLLEKMVRQNINKWLHLRRK